MATARSKQLSRALSAAREAADWGTEAGRTLLREALASRDAQLVADAARLVAQHTIGALEPELLGSYRELASRASADPGCLAKEALLAALDALEHVDAELFATAACYVQPEPGKAKGRDSAGRVRARAVLALARLGHPDLLLLLGARLGDEDGAVRLAAARAIGHRQQRETAGLLLLKLSLGDSEQQVLVECLRALFVVAPDHALPCARALLSRGEAWSELALSALGTAASDGAVELLQEELQARALASERREVIDALGLSLRPLARAMLLELVRVGHSADAEAALSALAIHRYDARLASQAREACAHSRELSQQLAELFG